MIEQKRQILKPHNFIYYNIDGVITEEDKEYISRFHNIEKRAFRRSIKLIAEQPSYNLISSIYFDDVCYNIKLEIHRTTKSFYPTPEHLYITYVRLSPEEHRSLNFIMINVKL